MNCKTHGIPMIDGGTVANIFVCPKCMQEREDEPAYALIPKSSITVEELYLFDDPLVRAKERYVQIDLSKPVNAANFLNYIESRNNKYIDHSAIARIDLVNKRIYLKEDMNGLDEKEE